MAAKTRCSAKNGPKLHRTALQTPLLVVVDLLAAVHLDDEEHDKDGEDGARETSGLVAV